MNAMAAASTANRKYKRQESVRDILHRDVNSKVTVLPDKKEWCAEYSLQILMLNGWGVVLHVESE